MTDKMTNVRALAIAIDALSTVEGKEEVIEKLTNIKTSYEKKSKSEKKPTQTQLDNERIKAQIVELLGDGAHRTVSDICKELEGEYSNQKISSLCSILYDKGNGVISKVTDKRKSFYFVEL